MTGSAKTGLIDDDSKFNFCHKHKDTSIHYQVSLPNEDVLGGLLLLAASSQPIGNPYEQSGSNGEGRGLSVTVKLNSWC